MAVWHPEHNFSLTLACQLHFSVDRDSHGNQDSTALVLAAGGSPEVCQTKMPSIQAVQLSIFVALPRCERRQIAHRYGEHPSEFRGLQV